MTQKISQKGDILITGGSGFIGNYVVDLLKKKYDLVVIDLVDPKIPGTKFQKIDLRKPFKINSDFKTSNLIFSTSNISLSFPLRVLPEGNFNF